MRVSFAQGYDNTLRNINRRKEQIDRLANSASSGERLTEPGDDPFAWSQTLSMKQGLRELEQFEQNLQFGTGWGQATENALSNLSDRLSDAKQQGILAVSVEGIDNKNAIAEALDQILQEALDVANTEYGDDYLFSGQSSPQSPSGPPFDSDDLTYEGGTEHIEVRLSKNVRKEVNLTGQEVFFTDPTDPNSNILQTIKDLRDAVRGGDTDSIQTQLTKLDTAFEHVNAMSAQTGARLASLDRQDSMLQSLKLDNQTRLSEIKDADMTEVILQLQQNQTALEAALRVTGILDDLSLAKML